MNNVSIVRDCYGCGVCSASCPKSIISISINRDGFYEPRIKDAGKCIKCGICLDVCAFNHHELSLQNPNILSWAAWSNDNTIRKKCSSGGIGFEIGKQLIEKGYKAVGCRYNYEEHRAEHFIATTAEEFIQSIGSKYIQSYTEKAFKQINRKDEKYFISGTPCQIDSFRRMIQKFHCEDNFILLDFFCHCVPSIHAWISYCRMIEPKIGNVIYTSWRNKDTFGWHDSYNLFICGTKSKLFSKMSKGDLFFKLFLGDFCIGPQCYKACKYKWNHSSADIRIGDFWGSTYDKEEKGVNALISFTERGKDVIESLKNVTLVEYPFKIVAEGQMKKNAKPREVTPLVRIMLRKGYRIDGIPFQALLFIQKLINIFR